MKKWTRIAALLAVGATLAACSSNMEESAAEPESTQKTTNETTSEMTTQTDHQAVLDQAKAQYEADQLDEAAGSLSVLLEEDLTDFSEIQSEAETLQEEINLAQAEQARQVAGVSSDKDEYQLERQSSVLGEEYLAETGQSIEDATDEALGNWLIQREAKVKESEAEAEKETQPENQFATDAEAEDFAFEQTMDRLQLEKENYIFFVDKTEEEWVSVEVRETIEQDGVEWTNLIGLYRFNLQDETIEKLNSLNNEFQSVE